ncbi:ParA family protein [Altericroceibacterium spongiae]|uniref:ParA family protein n=1 Tax=Altericroceibacterium spongiae TaxID=2320269 RepID=A0A420EM55_9SPHN|nr:ParA family protein [Altericroceibacterium spongiae]RKF21730.1 ParA family protein [Altericroceibacterium spongiae]
MAVIAVYSVKGGVGKTTIASNLAWCSATISCRKTLLWDLDPAGGAAYLLGIEDPDKPKAHSIFSRDRAPAKLIQRTAYDRLDILPADESLRSLDNQLVRIGKRKRLAKMADSLSHKYERILLDCPPVLNEISAQVIRAADLVIVPMPPSPLSSRAFQVVAYEIKRHTKNHPPLLPVLSMLDLRRSLHREAREAHPNWPLVPQASAIEQCAVKREPVGQFASSSPAARAFARIWSAIERKLAERFR